MKVLAAVCLLAVIGLAACAGSDAVDSGLAAEVAALRTENAQIKEQIGQLEQQLATTSDYVRVLVDKINETNLIDKSLMDDPRFKALKKKSAEPEKKAPKSE
jgi:Tfp pilus assembly protein PilO